MLLRMQLSANVLYRSPQGLCNGCTLYIVAAVHTAGPRQSCTPHAATRCVDQSVLERLRDTTHRFGQGLLLMPTADCPWQAVQHPKLQGELHSCQRVSKALSEQAAAAADSATQTTKSISAWCVARKLRRPSPAGGAAALTTLGQFKPA